MTRLTALGAPLLICGYGVLRLIDGRDGDHGPGLAWNLGHLMFLLAIGLLAALMVRLHRLVRSASRPLPADLFLALGLLGAGCFVVVIAGDLSATIDDAVTVPDAIMLLGPLAFMTGLIGPLVWLSRSRSVSPWSPALALLGFVVFSANLDLLPLGAALLLTGLAPLVRLDRAETPSHPGVGVGDDRVHD